MKKRLLSLLTALCMMLVLLPMALATETADVTFTVEDIHYRVTEGNKVEVYNPNWVESALPGQEVSDYTGDVTIPATVDYENQKYDVTAIAAVAFASANVSSVTLPDSIVRIGDNAFKGCNAETITLGSGLKEIGPYAFNSCKFESLNIPDGVITIGNGAFTNCGSLDSLNIPGSVTTIGEQAFSMCGNLKTLQLNEGITAIGMNAFQLCGSLADLTIPASVTSLSEVGDTGVIITALDNYPNVSGVTFAKGSPFNVQDGILYTNNQMVTILSDDLGDVTIPDGVTEIPLEFFNEQSTLTSIVIPEGVTEIPYMAFTGCVNLKRAQLPEGVTSIGDYAFDLTVKDGGGNFVNNNPQLEAINIPASVTHVGENFLGGVKADGKTALIFEGENPPTFAAGALAGISGTGMNSPTIYFPAAAKDAYMNENGSLAQGGLISAPDEDEEPDNQYALSISEEAVSVEAGKTVGLTVTSTVPTDAVLKWSSDNSQVATVNDHTITGVGAGTARITASIELNGITLVSDTCTVTVTAHYAPSSSSDDDDDGYSVGVDAGKHGSVTVSPRTAEKGDTVTITVKPDKGYELKDLTVTAKNGKTMKLTQEKSNKFTFKMPDSRVTVEATFAKIDEAPRFTDVPDGYWAEDAIQWAAENGYMNGNTATTFNPEGKVSRQQLWMILARLSGYQPADFNEAKVWAVDNGVSDGTNPGAAVSRQQLVTILYRYARLMNYQTSGAADLTVFPDYASVAEYAQEAMSWSVDNGIVGGTAQGTLNPAGTATRAQFATILNRFCENVVE